MRPLQQRSRQLIAAFLATGALFVVASARAEEPRRLAAQPAMPEAQARTACVPTLVVPGHTCAVDGFGAVGVVAGHALFYAHYDITPSPGDPLYPLHYRRVVIFERAGIAVRPILITGDDPAYYYGTPEIIRSPDRVLLHIPAYESGTGNFNRESLYAWTNDSWRDVDVTSWLDELGKRLPDRLRILRGIYPDYATMQAETPLWREDDGGICANGGRARIALRLAGDRIAVSDVHREKAGECGEPMPAPSRRR